MVCRTRHPATPWLPLEGPPGNGKTSLAVSCAGCFGLAIYLLPLSDGSIGDQDFTRLFQLLPFRCIVLLEDIDCAGIRPQPNDNDESEGKGNAKKPGIPLATLLNVLDGAGSQEGRVVMMTTNHPERLDDALTRPGRVDHVVTFTNIDQDQARNCS